MTNKNCLLLAIFAIAQLSPVLPAKALPFKSDCSSMTAYFNGLPWRNPTKFSGFGPKLPGSDNDFMVCPGGYITEKLSTGTRVCMGFMRYTRDGGPDWGPPEPTCKWK